MSSELESLFLLGSNDPFPELYMKVSPHTALTLISALAKIYSVWKSFGGEVNDRLCKAVSFFGSLLPLVYLLVIILDSGFSWPEYDGILL